MSTFLLLLVDDPVDPEPEGVEAAGAAVETSIEPQPEAASASTEDE